MSLTSEQLFQQALHDYAAQLPMAPDPAALAARLRLRDTMVKVYRLAAAGGAVVALVAAGLVFATRQHDDEQSLGLPGVVGTARQTVVTGPGTSDPVVGDGSDADPDPEHPGGTITLGDAGTTVVAETPDDSSTTTTTPPTSSATTTTTSSPSGYPLPTLPNGDPGPNPGPTTTRPGVTPTQPGVTTTPPGPTTSAPGVSTTAPTTVPPTTVATTTTAPTTTTTPPVKCSAYLTPSIGPSPGAVTFYGNATPSTTVTFDAGGNGSPNTGSTTTNASGIWQVPMTLRVPTRVTTITVTATCADGSKASATYTRR